MKWFIKFFTITLFSFFCLTLLANAEIHRRDIAHELYLYPIVRVTAAGAVGSGTIIYSKQNEESTFSNYVLTNHHVVADAIKIKDQWDSSLGKMVKQEQRSIIHVEIFQYKQMSTPVGTMRVEADIVTYNEREDMALVKLRYEQKLDYVANMPMKDDTEFYRVFDETVAVGCSLGWPPLPTHGEITRLNTQIDSLPYDMSSAQIIFGNSGGAMFTADGRFIGIPSRVAVVGWSSAIPHMGFFIPVRRIYIWLTKEHFDFVFDTQLTEANCLEEREKEIEAKKKAELGK